MAKANDTASADTGAVIALPHYRIEEDSFIDNRYVAAGSEIDSASVPGPHWKPLNSAAEQAQADAQAAEAERQKQLKAVQVQIDLAQAVLDSNGLG